MCLTIRVTTGTSRDDALASVATTPSLRFQVEKGRGLALHACDLLSDDADWNAASWAMTAEGAGQLADAFAALFGRVAGDLVIEALWGGDKATSETTVSRSELVELARHSGLGTKTRYLVVG